MNDYLAQFREMLASSPIEEKNRDSNVLILDGLNMWIRIWQAIPVLSSNGEHIGGISGFLKSIGSVIRQFNPTRCIVVFDGSGGSLRRRKLFNGYKSNRTPNLNQFKSEFKSLEEEQASMKMQFSRMLEYLNHLPITVIQLDHIEADDSIASITTQYYDDNTKITIVSTDRDFLQLVTEYVSVYNPVKKMLYDPASIQSEYGLDHRNYLLYRILTGDKSDAIPGIPGLGLKTLLKEYPLDRHLELSEFLALTLTKAADKSPKKIIASILENIDTIELNFKLMQLSDVDISLHSKNQIRDCIDAEIPRLDKFKILKMIHTDKINSENWNVDSWISNTFSTLNYWK